MLPAMTIHQPKNILGNLILLIRRPPSSDKPVAQPRKKPGFGGYERGLEIAFGKYSPSNAESIHTIKWGVKTVPLRLFLSAVTIYTYFYCSFWSVSIVLGSYGKRCTRYHGYARSYQGGRSGRFHAGLPATHEADDRSGTDWRRALPLSASPAIPVAKHSGINRS